MIGKSNSFRQVTPFYPKPGLLGDSYRAFPLDISGTPPVPFGCLAIRPLSDFTSTQDEDSVFSPLEKVYTLFNVGGASLDWTLASSEDWATPSVASGTLAAGASVQVTITLDPDLLADLPVGINTSTLSLVNVTNGCGDIALSVNAIPSSEFPVQSIIFQQFDGPFQYPLWLPRYGYNYYLNETITGSTKARYAPVGGSVGSRPCDTTTGPSPSYGTVDVTYSGSVTHNLVNSSVTGSVVASSYQDGIISAYDHNAGKTTVVTAGALSGLPGPFTEFYGIYEGEDSVTQKWYTRTSGPGFFPGSVGGLFDSIYCLGGSVTATTSNRVSVEMLGYTLAREGGVGTPAQTQTAGAFNTGTGVYAGNVSRAYISVGVDPTREQITGTFVFTVTPTVGDPYKITVIQDFPISGSTVTGTVYFPWIPDAVVHMDSWVYSYQKVLAETFESYDEGLQYVTLTSSPSWPNPILFGAPPPNECCWDDFESYPDNVNQDGITLMITGERFAGPATFSNQSLTEFSDNFEGYPIGENSVYAQGTGWSGPGSTTSTLYQNCWDEFETYAIGSLFVFDFTSTNNQWNGDGHSA